MYIDDFRITVYRMTAVEWQCDGVNTAIPYHDPLMMEKPTNIDSKLTTFAEIPEESFPYTNGKATPKNEDCSKIFKQ